MEGKNRKKHGERERADLYFHINIYKIHTHATYISHILDKFYFRGVHDATSQVTGIILEKSPRTVTFDFSGIKGKTDEIREILFRALASLSAGCEMIRGEGGN